MRLFILAILLAVHAAEAWAFGGVVVCSKNETPDQQWGVVIADAGDEQQFLLEARRQTGWGANTGISCKVPVSGEGCFAYRVEQPGGKVVALISPTRKDIDYKAEVECPGCRFATQCEANVSDNTSGATPPKRPPVRPQPSQNFDAAKIAALLDKRDPSRKAESRVALSSNEVNALMRRVRQNWNFPVGGVPASVVLRVKLAPNGTLSSHPEPVHVPSVPDADAFVQSALKAVYASQPFDMLLPEHYESWKDLEIMFDPAGLSQVK